MKLLTFIAFGVLFIASCQAICPRPTLPLTQIGSKYYFIETRLNINWYAARDTCRSYGMQLASILSQEENTALAAHLISIGETGQFFIGGNALGARRDWRWLASAEPMTFTSWNGGDPNNAGGDECVAILRSVVQNGVPRTLWIDQWLTSTQNFICEWQPCTIC